MARREASIAAAGCGGDIFGSPDTCKRSTPLLLPRRQDADCVTSFSVYRPMWRATSLLPFPRPCCPLKPAGEFGEGFSRKGGFSG